MTEKEVQVELWVNLGIAYTKAAQMLAGSQVSVETKTSTKTVETTEAPKTETQKAGFGLAGMSASEAMAVVTEAETEAVLKAIGSEEKARGSKARKTVLTAVQAKLNKLKNPPAQAEVAEEGKAFTSTSPATEPKDVKLFAKQIKAMTETQRDQYFDGSIDSLGKSLVANMTTETNDEFEDLGIDETSVTEVTQDELRTKLKAYAKINGPEKAYAVLAHFGAKKIKDLDVSKYSEVAMELA